MEDTNLTVSKANYEERDFSELDNQEKENYAKNGLHSLIREVVVTTGSTAIVLNFLTNPELEGAVSGAVLFTIVAIGFGYMAYERYRKLQQVLGAVTNQGGQE